MSCNHTFENPRSSCPSCSPGPRGRERITRLVPAARQTAEQLAQALERIAGEVRAGEHVAVLVVAVGSSGDHQIAQSTLGGPEGVGTTKDMVSLLGAVSHARCALELALVRALEG
jgi:hypothetical protein